MLRAGYDVKLASGVITAGGTLGILIPPSVMIIVYAAVAGQSVVKLYAAAMFPGFFLSLLYLVYIVGWAILNPKIAPALPEEQTRVPVPAWMRKLQSAYSPNMLVGLFAALLSPGKPRRSRRKAGRVDYWMLFKNFVAALVPLALIARHAVAAVVVRRHPPAGRRRRRGPGRSASSSDPQDREQTGPARPPIPVRRRVSTSAFGAHRPVLRGDRSLRYYWQHGRRAARGGEAADRLGDAARHPDGRRARGHPVRHHDRDRIRRRRRGRRLPARLPGAHAQLEAHQGSGIPDRQDDRHGVLAVRRLGAVLRGVRDPRRAGPGRALGARRSTCRRCSS